MTKKVVLVLVNIGVLLRRLKVVDFWGVGGKKVGVRGFVGGTPFVIILLYLVINFIFLMGKTSLFIRNDSDITGHFGIPSLVVKLAVITVKASLPRATIDITTSVTRGGALTIDGIANSGVFGLVMMVNIYTLVAPMIISKTSLGESFPFSVVYTVLLLIVKAVNVALNEISKVVLLNYFTKCVFCLVERALGRGERSSSRRISRVPLVSVPGTIVFVLVKTINVTMNKSIMMSDTDHVTVSLKVDRALIKLAVMSVKASLPRLIASVITTEGGRISVTLKGTINSYVFGVLVILKVTSTVDPVTFVRRGVVSVVILIMFSLVI